MTLWVSHLIVSISILFLICLLQIFEYVTVFPFQVPYRPLKHETATQYVLKDQYSGDTFFKGFNFEATPDPTHGHVLYQSEENANLYNLTYLGDNGLNYIQTDYLEQAPNGRKSVRISSKKHYTRGLFVLDAVHMPEGCGVWPAFWTTAVDSWPSKGEIDILEGVNLEKDNAFTLHTGMGCRMAKYRQQKGNSESLDCNVHAVDQWPNQGCGVKTTNSFGSEFNRDGGKVIAMQWEANFIRSWIFSRDAVPFDLSVDAPDPDLDVSKWGLPDATFESEECNIAEIFADHVIIINV